MTLPPRVVVVTRRTELDELLARHGTRGQAAFFLRTRGRDLDEIEARHRAQTEAVRVVMAGLPAEWRSGSVERADLSRFLFAPEDLVVVVGQDGLVANVAKYLDGQPVLGVDPEPGRNAGILVTHPPSRVAGLLAATVAGDVHLEHRVMVAATTDDGTSIRALNEVYVGHAGHQTARWSLRTEVAGQVRVEPQACSGLIVATGTGATGWCASTALERHSALTLPAPTEDRLAWFVREAWPSPTTGTSLTEGEVSSTRALELVVASDRLVAFGDGIEADGLTLTWGQSVRLRIAEQRLRLVVS